MELYISVKGSSDPTKEELEYLANELADEIREWDSVASIEFVNSEKIPQGAKGSGVDFGTILVKLAEVGTLSTLIMTLKSWFSVDNKRSIVMRIGDNELELNGLSKAEQKELIKWFQIQTGISLSHQE